MRFGVLLCFLCVVLSVPSVYGVPFQFEDAHVQTKSIDVAGSGRYTGFTANLDFPAGGDLSNYPSGSIFEYDDVIGSVTQFDIVLSGYGDNSNDPINIFVNVNGTWSPVASYNVNQNLLFTLTIDLVSNNLNYWDIGGGSGTSALQNISMLDFIGVDSFQVGYGCHFTHSSTTVRLQGSTWNGTTIPEPGSLLLLGIALMKYFAFIAFKRIQ